MAATLSKDAVRAKPEVGLLPTGQLDPAFRHSHTMLFWETQCVSKLCQNVDTHGSIIATW